MPVGNEVCEKVLLASLIAIFPSTKSPQTVLNYLSGRIYAHKINSF